MGLLGGFRDSREPASKLELFLAFRSGGLGSGGPGRE
jgi:hypothetical protein